MYKKLEDINMAGSSAISRTGNKALANAKTAKQDEFYTQLSDIENELRHYREKFRDKVVLCNCDDPYESNFFRYFALNFNALGLNKLIATCYDGSSVAGGRLPLLDIEGLKPEGKQPYAVEITNVPDINGDGAIDLSDVEQLLKSDGNVCRTLKGDAEYGAGDFRSTECVAYLEQADIVVTNPPFSLFREYIKLLVAHNKRFVILGNQNAVTTKEIFELIYRGEIWLGSNNGDMSFQVPPDYPPKETRYWVDDKGQKWRSFGTMCWVTNLDLRKRHEKLPLFKKYNEDDYPKYDNFDAIEVSAFKNIPCDYNGVMGVPLGFLAKHNPDQFEIVGITKTWFGLASKKYPTQVQVSASGKTSNVKKLNDGAAIKIGKTPVKKTYYRVENEVFIQTYPRILIRKRTETNEN
ncbi:adenine-specific methyltransferase EcoRI family protein [Qipengyuania gelatinilytica]|uniref:Adenine-specific methyltransferase EcoRI family protein n=1 Tax=Qipengyuania gelatinilytica TaxID=2867231 RepID=A0ABX9A1Z9_9SPHN|nr:adenine-specific methyltransferase EcoRI family protein [Qipengyuania gelatinilytica]QZD95258.1 adenine-specific methyltransferase EcoRI family protein [Qipengyuania gelatinilytica]